jgi:hypothetical protein
VIGGLRGRGGLPVLADGSKDRGQKRPRSAVSVAANLAANYDP